MMIALEGLLSCVYTIVFGNYGTGESGGRNVDADDHKKRVGGGFQMPLHYPRYKKADYEKMEEWKLDLLLREYGLSFQGKLEEKREFAIGAFVWPDQIDDD